jgi:hypothetical protein
MAIPNALNEGPRTLPLGLLSAGRRVSRLHYLMAACRELTESAARSAKDSETEQNRAQSHEIDGPESYVLFEKAGDGASLSAEIHAPLQ